MKPTNRVAVMRVTSTPPIRKIGTNHDKLLFLITSLLPINLPSVVILSHTLARAISTATISWIILQYIVSLVEGDKSEVKGSEVLIRKLK
jgi:hypothetical protein